MTFVAALVGALLGIVLFHDIQGLGLGAALGYLFAELFAAKARLARLEQTVRGAAPARDVPSTAPPRPTFVSHESRTAAEAPVPAAIEPTPASAATAAPVAEVAISGDSPPGRIDAALLRVFRFFTGGNAAVRIGVVVLFFGVAFLFKYAVEHSHFPPEARLLGATVGAIALLVFGWRLRERRAGYALTLQGGGVGLLYLTVFAALRLYALLPAGPAFALLVAACTFATVLALLQNAPVLAVLGSAGGFLAPVLASSGAGSHVALFSYYLLLNAGILVVSWFKAWRPLALVGFVSTFVLSSAWGYRYYRPEFLAGTEPFLIAFFALYVAIAVLFALRQPPNLRGYTDGTLVFGVPVVGFGLQAALVRSIPYALAWSSLALAAFYVLVAWTLFRRARDLRLIAQAFAGLGLVFATAAIPLALDARWSAVAWALEGAGVFWVGVRQRRRLPRAFAMALVAAAGVMSLNAGPLAAGALPVLNGVYVGALVLCAAALFIAFLQEREAAAAGWERAAGYALFALGLAAWYLGGLNEIRVFASYRAHDAAYVVFFALSFAAFEALGSRLAWPTLRATCAAWGPLLLLLSGAWAIFEDHPLGRFGYVAWPIALTSYYWLLRRHNAAVLPAWRRARHALGLWSVVVLVGAELGWEVARIAGGRDWAVAAWGVALAGALVAITRAPGPHWPLASERDFYLRRVAWPLVFIAWTWAVSANLSSGGDSAPLPYVPLFNPLDLAVAFVLLALLGWSRATAVDAAPRYVALGLASFVWLNGLLFRALHHLAGIDYTLDAMLHSVRAQASLSLFWATLGLAATAAATRLRQRGLWIAGAIMLAAVVAKLFFVDLSHTGTLARVVAFIGVGALLVLVGYVSPVPPRGNEGAHE